MGRLESKLDEVMGRFQQISQRVPPPAAAPAQGDPNQLYDQAAGHAGPHPTVRSVEVRHQAGVSPAHQWRDWAARGEWRDARSATSGSCERPPIKNASLSSQAVGPPNNNTKMSADGHDWLKLGKKMLSLQLLAPQNVHPDDSVLGELAITGRPGLNTTYTDMIQAAFGPEWWKSDLLVDTSLGDDLRAEPSPFDIDGVILHVDANCGEVTPTLPGSWAVVKTL